jgi:hypothetical protein
MLSILLHFSGIIIALISGTIAVALHSYWSKGMSWYASANHIIQAAIGVVITAALAFLATKLPFLQPAADACVTTAGNVLSQACLDAIGGLFSKENVATVLGILITLFGHGAVTQAKINRNLVAMKPAGVTLER